MFSENLISKLLKLKGGLVELVLIAVGLSFFVGVVSSILIQIFSLSNPSILLLSMTAIALLILFFAHRILTSLERNIKLEGTLVFQNKNKILVPLNVDRYRLCNDMADNLNAAFAENAALKKIWGSAPLNYDSDHSKFNSLVLQAFEYFLLERLSLNIQAYFAKNGIKELDLKIYSRVDMPDFLFKNKFFDLFTKPMEDRPSFIKHLIPNGDDNDRGKTVLAMAENGALFKHFELALPLGSQLKREVNGAIHLKTKIFKLILTPRFEGYCSVWPQNFEKLYLGLSHFKGSSYVENICSFQINLDINVKFNQTSLLMGKGWEYYSWLDSLIDEFRDSIDDQVFLKSIGWDEAYTSYIISKNQLIAQSKSHPKSNP